MARLLLLVQLLALLLASASYTSASSSSSPSSPAGVPREYPRPILLGEAAIMPPFDGDDDLTPLAVQLQALDVETGAMVAAANVSVELFFPSIMTPDQNPRAAVDAVTRRFYTTVLSPDVTYVYGWDLDTWDLVVNCSTNFTGSQTVAVVLGGKFLYLPFTTQILRLDPATCALQQVFTYDFYQHPVGLRGAWAWDADKETLIMYRQLNAQVMIAGFSMATVPATVSFNVSLTSPHTLSTWSMGSIQLVALSDGTLRVLVDNTTRVNGTDQHAGLLLKVDHRMDAVTPFTNIPWQAGLNHPLLFDGQELVTLDCPLIYRMSVDGTNPTAVHASVAGARGYCGNNKRFAMLVPPSKA